MHHFFLRTLRTFYAENFARKGLFAYLMNGANYKTLRSLSRAIVRAFSRRPSHWSQSESITRDFRASKACSFVYSVQTIGSYSWVINSVSRF